MDIKITPSKDGFNFKGQIDAISSKSDVHRLLICSALSDTNDFIQINLNGFSDDINATIDCLRSLGSEIIKEEKCVKIKPIGTNLKTSPILNCLESGSTFRFLIPVTCALGINAKFEGSGRLPERPIKPLCDELIKNGCSFSNDCKLPFSITNKLQSGKFHLKGDISSQFITGLLFALPILDGDSEIVLTTPLQSKGYIDMTLATLSLFGINVTSTKTGYYIKGNQKYSPEKMIITADGDWSNAAFFICAGAINGDISYNGLTNNSLQKDRFITDVLRSFNANIKISDNEIRTFKGNLVAIDIDAGEIPDLVPILAVCASVAKGVTKIYNAKRLRLKESDRLNSVATCLKNLGADIIENDDNLVITGKEFLHGGIIDSFGDHRIVMSMAIASCVCKNEVTITNADAFTKSYPNFFEHFKKLGGSYNVI